MTELLRGKPIVDEMKRSQKKRVDKISSSGTVPTLRIVRIGARDDDLAYEGRIKGAAGEIGIALEVAELAEDASQDELLSVIECANADASVSGILLFRPLPKGLVEAEALSKIAPEKDVDGVSPYSMANLYAAKAVRIPRIAGENIHVAGETEMNFFLPCTAEAVMQMLIYYGIDIEGKNAVVIGRSTVIGKPVSMLLLSMNATVTLGHSRSCDLAAVSRAADIVIVCAGVTAVGESGMPEGAIGCDYLSQNQTVIDVGIHADEDGNLFGDVGKAAYGLVSALTPVPGGLGAVTTQILMDHVITAAEWAARAKG